MRIAIIHLGRKGGGPPYLLEMARALYSAGEDVCVFTSKYVENRKSFENQQFKVIFCDTYESKLGYVWSIISFYKILSVAKLIKSFRPNIIYSTLFHSWDPFLFPLLKEKGISRIKTLHDVEPHMGAGRFIKWQNKHYFQDAEKYIVLSRKYVKVLLDKGINSDDVCVIPHAGYTYYCNENKREHDRKPFVQLLFFGTISKYKGLGLLLDSFALLLKEFPHTKLKIVGSGSIEDVRHKIEALGNSVEVHNVWVKDEDVADYIYGSDIMVLPYIHATQSGVIPLAYAFSLPVVATNVGCLDEQIIDNETGKLVQNVNSVDFANKISEFLRDPESIYVCGKNAHEFMIKYLTWDASAQLFINFISKNK